jgi:hypothetical protein
MKSRAGLSGHLATDRSKIWETGIVSKSASQRTPGGYDLIQGAAGMTYSYLRERTAWATLRPLMSERKEKLTRLVHQPIVNSQPLTSGHVVGSPEEVINPFDKGRGQTLLAHIVISCLHSARLPLRWIERFNSEKAAGSSTSAKPQNEVRSRTDKLGSKRVSSVGH